MIASLQAAINCGERANNDFTVCLKRQSLSPHASGGEQTISASQAQTSRHPALHFQIKNLVKTPILSKNIYLLFSLQ